MGTVMPSKPQRNDTRQARWDRLKRASLFEQYGELQDQGLSQRQAAQQLEVPRTTLQAWPLVIVQLLKTGSRCGLRLLVACGK